jgi:hypothetical protein
VVLVLCWTVLLSGVVVVVVEVSADGAGVTTGDLLSSTRSFLLTKHPLIRTALAIVSPYAMRLKSFIAVTSFYENASAHLVI